MPILSAPDCDSGRMTSIQPELWIDRAGQAIAFYAAAFGARLLHRVGDGDDIVAQLAVGEAAFWVAAAGPGDRQADRPLAAGPDTSDRCPAEVTRDRHPTTPLMRRDGLPCPCGAVALVVHHSAIARTALMQQTAAVYALPRPHPGRPRRTAHRPGAVSASNGLSMPTSPTTACISILRGR